MWVPMTMMSDVEMDLKQVERVKPFDDDDFSVCQAGK